MNPQTITNARRARQSHQKRLLQAVDESGRPAMNEEGEYYLDFDRAPVVLADVGVPPALRQATFADSAFSQVEAVADWYVDILNGKSARYLALFLGKSSNYTAAAVLRNAVKQGRSVAWYDWHSFTSRYTDGIERSRVLGSGNVDEMSVAALELDEARDEDFHLRYVYDVLVLTDLDLDDLRDFAVPDIVSMLRVRSDYMLTTVITVSAGNSGDLERDSKLLGKRGALLRLLEDDGVNFDGR